ncbi:AMP-binding protein [Kitasatospora aburaviensis]
MRTARPARPPCSARNRRCGSPERAARAARRCPGRAHVFLTSGSTGTPTGVVRTAAAVLADARRVGTFLGYRPDAPVTVAAPLFHAYGFNYGLIAPLALGAPRGSNRRARCRPSWRTPSGPTAPGA